MRRLVDRSRTGRRGTRWPNHCRRSAGDCCAGCRKLYRRIPPAAFTMNLSRMLAGAVVCIGMSASADLAFAERTNEIAEAARPIDEGVPEVAVYQLQKLTTRLNGADTINAKEKLAEALIAAHGPAPSRRDADENRTRQTAKTPLACTPGVAQSTAGKGDRIARFAGEKTRR